MTKDKKTLKPNNESESLAEATSQPTPKASQPEASPTAQAKPKTQNKAENRAEPTQSQEHNVEKNSANSPKTGQKNNAETDRSFSHQKQGASATQGGVARKKGGSALALLALIIALGVGAGGYYLGQQKFAELEQQIQRLGEQPAQATALLPNNDEALQEVRTQLSQLNADSQTNSHKLADLTQQLTQKQQAFNSLQEQVNKINNVVKTEPNDWLLSEVDFLLNNALRKLVLDGDVDTAIALLQVASQSLEQVADADIVPIRKALHEDLKQLLAVNNIDQNAIMQRLSLLANNLDELEILNVNFGEDNVQLSDSMQDWKENVKKSALSFLNHFIRINPRSSNDKGLLAPNQDIYLRENIRLRLQIAILAVPRQQNELYKQSLEAVAAWVRSYFNTNTPTAQHFLQQVDNLMEQSIYVDLPTKLTSLNLLDQRLHRQGQAIQRIELRVDKDLTDQASAEATTDKAITDKATTDEASTTEQPSDASLAEPKVDSNAQRQEPEEAGRLNPSEEATAEEADSENSSVTSAHTTDAPLESEAEQAYPQAEQPTE